MAWGHLFKSDRADSQVPGSFGKSSAEEEGKDPLEQRCSHTPSVMMLGGGSVSSVKPANNAFAGWGNRGFGKNGLKIIQEEGLVPTGIDEPGI